MASNTLKMYSQGKLPTPTRDPWPEISQKISNLASCSFWGNPLQY